MVLYIYRGTKENKFTSLWLKLPLGAVRRWAASIKKQGAEANPCIPQFLFQTYHRQHVSEFRILGGFWQETQCAYTMYFLTPLRKAEMARRRLGQLTVIKHVLFLQWNLQIHQIKHNSSQQLSWKKVTCAKHKRKTFSFQSNFDVRIVDKDGWSYETVPITPLLDVRAKGPWSPLYPVLISLWCFGERKIILKVFHRFIHNMSSIL